MIFHIAVCSPDAGLRSGLERQCMEFFARRADACIVEHLPDTDALLRKDGEGVRYDLYLLELSGSAAPVGLAAAGELRRRGRRAPLAFVARTTAHKAGFTVLGVQDAASADDAPAMAQVCDQFLPDWTALDWTTI